MEEGKETTKTDEEKYFTPERIGEIKKELDELPKKLKELSEEYILDIETIKGIIDSKDYEGIKMFMEQIRLLKSLYENKELNRKYYKK